MCDGTAERLTCTAERLRFDDDACTTGQALVVTLGGNSEMQIRVDDPNAPYVTDLLDHHLRELQGVMADHDFALDASGLSAASVTFWTAWNDETLVGFGALKELDRAHGELKSMRVAPAALGTGSDEQCLSILSRKLADAATLG
jgi:hypothetical protein